MVAELRTVRFRLFGALGSMLGPALAALLVAVVCVSITASGALAQTNAEVAQVVDDTGRFVEFDVDAELEASIERANTANIGFIWLAQSGGDAQLVASGVRSSLQDINSRYVTVVVLNSDGVWVDSRDGAAATNAADSAFSNFLAGDVAGGLDTVTTVMSGSGTGNDATATTAVASDGSATSDSGSSTDAAPSTDSGGGFPWLLVLLLGGLAFLAFRFFNGRRRANKTATQDMERDRLEIREQLRDNADRVIDLGDRAIAHGDAELIRMYEQASQDYQHVSLSIDAASSADEIDKLDETIDNAEWKFEVIEARIEGRPEPASPADLEPPPPTGAPSPPSAGEQPTGRSGGTVTRRGRTIPPLGSPRDEPALGQDESILGRRTSSNNRASNDRASNNRRSSGMGGGIGRMLTGGAGRMLMSVLASVLLGGLGNRGGSQRTQRRRTTSGGGLGGGGLGGGVLRNR